MLAQSFPGSYEDNRGVESITWRFVPTQRYGPRDRRFEIHTVVRGIAVWAFDFDGLAPDDEDPSHQELLSLSAAGELDRCVLSGDLPCIVQVAGERRLATVRFTLDLRLREPTSAPRNLRLEADIDGTTYQAVDDWFEGGMKRLEAEFPSHIRLLSCVTCLYSDYSPDGRGLISISCHREAKEQYLAVRSKLDYRAVPVTEEVPETYHCSDYQRRIPGTGYRG